MDNQLLMDNYLSVLKSNVEVYVHGTLESSNVKNRQILKSGLDITIDSQANTFDIMASYNWYPVTNVKCSEIKKVLNKVKDK